MASRGEVQVLMDQVEAAGVRAPMTVEAEAWNYLVDFTAGLIHEDSEGERLISLSMAVLRAALARKST